MAHFLFRAFLADTYRRFGRSLLLAILLLAGAAHAQSGGTANPETVTSAFQPRCLRVPEGNRGTAFSSQLCLSDSVSSIDGKLLLTLRGLKTTGSLPALRLLSGGAKQTFADPLILSEEIDRTPIDVVAVIMMARPSETWPDASDALRDGIGELVRATYAIPGSRFGLIGYSHDKKEFPLELPARGSALLDETHRAEIDAALSTLKIREYTEPKWVLSNALGRAVTLLADGAVLTPARRRLLVLFTHGADSDQDVAAERLEAAAREARGLKIAVSYVPPPGYSKAISPLLRGLVDSSGGLIFPCSKSNDELRAHLHSISESLQHSLRAEVALDDTSGGALRLELAQGGAVGESLIRFDRPRRGLEEGVPTRDSGVSAPAESTAVEVFLASTLLIGMLIVALLVLRWLIQRTAEKGQELAQTSRGSHLCAWLHWVDRGRDIPLARLPHRIGNDLDCETVTLGVGSQKQRVVLLPGDNSSSFLLQALDSDGVHDSERRRQRSLYLQDGVEFFVNQQRFKLFVTQLGAAPDRGA